jgi:hypothetical protein
MNKTLFILIFALGFLSAYFLNYSLLAGGLEKPFGFSFAKGIAPANWIDEKDIIITDDSVIINIKNASLSKYADSGSMVPTLDKDANGIRIIPENEAQINVGDIVTYEKAGDLIVHRIIEKGQDNEGVYFVPKGDNNDFSDSKIRFSDIKYVTVALIY